MVQICKFPDILWQVLKPDYWLSKAPIQPRDFGSLQNKSATIQWLHLPNYIADHLVSKSTFVFLEQLHFCPQYLSVWSWQSMCETQLVFIWWTACTCLIYLHAAIVFVRFIVRIICTYCIYTCVICLRAACTCVIRFPTVLSRHFCNQSLSHQEPASLAQSWESLAWSNLWNLVLATCHLPGLIQNYLIVLFVMWCLRCIILVLDMLQQILLQYLAKVGLIFVWNRELDKLTGLG